MTTSAMKIMRIANDDSGDPGELPEDDAREQDAREPVEGDSGHPPAKPRYLTRQFERLLRGQWPKRLFHRINVNCLALSRQSLTRAKQPRHPRVMARS